MHLSIPLNCPCEIIETTKINPLISKCQIKVCYVGEQPNRNGTIITKEVATEMANSLPGSPIVGFYNKETKDFEEHNRDFEIKDRQFIITDATRPYGFVDLNAKCWFQKFADDGVEHEYLCTEGWLWTGQYSECERIITKGNNQSMELDEKSLKGCWTKSNNNEPSFFIINEAIISKLCVLGEDFEPCFEGASVKQVQFSFEDGFKQQLFSMMKELKNLLNEGGTQPMFTQCSVSVGDSLWNALYNHVHEISNDLRIEGVFEEGEQKFAVLQNGDNYCRLDFSMNDNGEFIPAETMIDMESYIPSDEPQFALKDVEEFEENFNKKDKADEDYKKKAEDENEDSEDKIEQEESSNSEDNSETTTSPEEEDEDKNKKKYVLEEIPEYVELTNKFNALEKSFNELTTEHEALKAENAILVDFKLASERKDKEAMIADFYMLSDEDKADVVANIDTYSLDDIEAKLSIICVRNKVDFNFNQEKENQPITYNLDGHEDDDLTPPWVKAVLDTAKELN